MHLAVLFISLVYFARSTPTSSYECGACVLMITEMESAVKKVDPTRMIEVGSFRVNPSGGQKGLQKVQFARSDAHLNEIFDGMCEKSKDYKLVVNTLTGKAVFAHKDATYLKEETKSGVQSKLHDACNDFADSHEEQILKFLKTEVAEPVKEFCYTMISVCSSVDVSPLPPNDPVEEKATEEEENDVDDDDDKNEL